MAERSPLPRRLILKNANRPPQIILSKATSIADLKAELHLATGIPPHEQLLSCGAAMFACDAADLCLPDLSMLFVSAKCLGGKGGFGAMLRGQQSRPGMKKVESNTGAMRDLSGRRLRHVEQDSKLEEWAKDEAKRKAERELQKQQKKQKTYERTHEAAEQYVAEATIDVEEVSNAVMEGITEAKKKAAEKASEDAEKKRQAAIEKAKKLGAMWGDADEGSDDSADEPSGAPKPAPNSSKPVVTADKPADAQPQSGSTNGAKTANPTAENASAATGAEDAAPVPPAASAAAEGAAAAAEVKEAVPDVDPTEPVDVEAAGDVTALVGLGGDRLKHALLARGLKGGGTVQQRAERLWSVRGLARDQWPAGALQPPTKK